MKRISPEQIVAALKELESGGKVSKVAGTLGVAVLVIERWHQKYAGLDATSLRITCLHREVRKLRKAVEALSRIAISDPRDSPQPAAPSRVRDDTMLSVAEAAAYIGYTASGLRKVIDQSRARLFGHQVSGPTIKFFQAGKWGAIKFRKEWLDDFITSRTNDPTRAIGHSKSSRRGRNTSMEHFRRSPF